MGLEKIAQDSKKMTSYQLDQKSCFVLTILLRIYRITKN